MKTTIREIRNSDYPHLLNLFKEFAVFQNSMDKMTNTLELMEAEQEYIKGFVVCNEQNKVIAYATYFSVYNTWSGKSLYMEDLYVTPKYRGEGIGTKLIQQIKEKAKAENCKKLKWQVSDWNKPAITFYKSLGAMIDSVELNCDLVL